eukprot:9204374-Prorocentrum_lima.AAC.1
MSTDLQGRSSVNLPSLGCASTVPTNRRVVISVVVVCVFAAAAAAAAEPKVSAVAAVCSGA